MNPEPETKRTNLLVTLLDRALVVLMLVLVLTLSLPFTVLLWQQRQTPPVTTQVVSKKRGQLPWLDPKGGVKIRRNAQKAEESGVI